VKKEESNSKENILMGLFLLVGMLLIFWAMTPSRKV
jgi:hypothetical protein